MCYYMHMGFFDRWKSLFTDNDGSPTAEMISMSQKASGAARAIAEDTNVSFDPFHSMSPGMSDLNKGGDEPYDRLLDKYARYVWVYVAIDRIVNAASQVDLVLKDKRKKGKPEDEAKGLGFGLKPLIEQPNPWMGTVEFIETIGMHLLLTGNAFIEFAELNSRGQPKEMYVLNPKNMKVVPSRRNFVSKYQYIVNDKVISFDTDEICHIKLPDPRGESHYGLSPLTAVRWTIEQEAQVVNWNIAYFNNAAWPSGIITAADGLNDVEFKRARNELRRNYEGTSKVGKVMLLTGGLDWKQTTPNPKDLDFLNLKKVNRQEILSMFRVPPSIAGIFEFENSTSRSAGVRDQHVQFWSMAVQPLLRRVIRCLNRDLVTRYNPNFFLEPDVSKIPALKETEEMLLTRAETAGTLIEKAGWSPNSVLSQLYPDMKPFEWGDEHSPGYMNSQIIQDDTGDDDKSDAKKPKKPVKKPKEKPVTDKE